MWLHIESRELFYSFQSKHCLSYGARERVRHIGRQCLTFKGVTGRRCSQGAVTLGRHRGAVEDKTVTVVLRPLDEYSGFPPSTVSRLTQGEAFQRDSEEG